MHISNPVERGFGTPRGSLGPSIPLLALGFSENESHCKTKKDTGSVALPQNNSRQRVVGHSAAGKGPSGKGPQVPARGTRRRKQLTERDLKEGGTCEGVQSTAAQ